jgi:hypothetical protein
MEEVINREERVRLYEYMRAVCGSRDLERLGYLFDYVVEVYGDEYAVGLMDEISVDILSSDRELYDWLVENIGSLIEEGEEEEELEGVSEVVEELSGVMGYKGGLVYVTVYDLRHILVDEGYSCEMSGWEDENILLVSKDGYIVLEGIFGEELVSSMCDIKD